MKKLKNRIGMTMVELMLVVAIIVILFGVSFIAVYNYQRSLGQLERDGIAKEIFVAAQNHLTVAYGEGYLGTTDFGVQGTLDDDAKKEIFFYAVNGNCQENSVLGQMLPFGSIDETVRAGGSYIIRYQKSTGTVLDVFYCTRSGSPRQFNHKLGGEEGGPGAEREYATVMGLTGDEHKRERRTYEAGGNSILGWYGGAAAANLPTLPLDPPSITVYNEEKLYVEVQDTNSGKSAAKLQLIVEGLSSGAKKAIPLTSTSNGRVTPDTVNHKYTIVLDDITRNGFHFAELGADSGTFIPGENIRIRAVAHSTSALANISYSGSSTTNSLFGSISDTDSNEVLESAAINNIRHLENLDPKVSNLGSAEHPASAELEKFKIGKAVQAADLDWNTFQEKTLNSDTVILYSNQPGNFYSANQSTDRQYYYPISPDYALTYDGRSHSISNIRAKGPDAGLFGSTTTVSSIDGLELIDCSITGTTSAGALAGTLSNCTVTNVLARTSEASSSAKITSSASAGGLIGTIGAGTAVEYSAAAVPVSGGTNAGGLIGSANGGTILNCFSGGHTADGSYEKWVKGDASYPAHGCDVTGETAGGLIGSAGSATIYYSYSTCSVSGTSKAGGFAGEASGSISNCYATGLIDQTKPSATKFAFVASGTPTLSDNHYYMAINEVPSTQPNAKEDETEPMLPYSGYELSSSNLVKIKPIDLNADSYNDFVGPWNDGSGNSWNPARAFDSALVQYYSGKYTLRAVDELNSALPTNYSDWNQLFVSTHYGDWPSPEVFFINTAP